MDLISLMKNDVKENEQRLIDELIAFLSQPSVSTTGLGIDETVRFLKGELDRLGFKTRLLALEGANPVVYGEAGDATAPVTLCVYGHYDVQDPDPLSEWHTDPFKPEIHDGLIFARGATDDKGNLFANIKAAEMLLRFFPEHPLHLKFFFEGEEEIGSPNLRGYLEEYADLLRADATIVCDRGIHESGRPQIYLGDKGLVSVKVGCRRTARDIHSGHAPLIPSSIWDLVRLLQSLKDPGGRILIPGFYGSVVPPSEEELALLKSIPFDPDQFMRQYGISRTLVSGDPTDLLRALVFEPTANISGIKSGWMGEKPKTIIPAHASAFLDFRLVKGQKSKEVADMIAQAIDASPFGPFDVEIKPHFEAYRCSPNDPWARLAIDAAREVTGEDPVVWPLLDGSGPLCWFHRYLGGPTFIIGLGAPFETANTHAPNENIGIDQYLTGIVQMAAFLYRAAAIKA
ncbi:M20/M25/M40 family metallo-hydrolase [bacterium]|nr:M20/M25/M40 family metallo-hydrolase [bacterium]